jgi:hypothetical protein
MPRKARSVDEGTPVVLAEFPTRMMCELAAARLRTEGIEVAATGPSERYLQFRTGHYLYVNRGDVERAAPFVDWSEALRPGVPEPKSKLGDWLWHRLGGGSPADRTGA